MAYKVELLETVPLTPDTAHYVFSKPHGYRFKPGQATNLSIDQDGWRDEERPFTFTSDPEAPVLSFVIKSYPDHDGVTKELPDLTPGDVYFGRGQTILKQRERIKRKTIETRRLLHRKSAA